METNEIRQLTEGSIVGQAKAFAPTMTPRERWRRVFHYQAVDRIPCYEFGYWAELYAEWHAQGLPSDLTTERQVDDYFGYDRRVGVPVRVDLLPAFEVEVLEETETHQIVREANGAIAEINKDGSSSIPHYHSFPIKDRRSWDEFKERLDPDTPGRLPANVLELASTYRDIDIPVGINIGSIFGRIRNWTGFEHLAMMVYDDLDLVDEMVEAMCVLITTTIKPLLSLFEFDYAGGWEDIAFNSGPMISPAMFRSLLVPRYKRIADLLREHGVDVIWTDCDGNISQIAGLWLEAGYNCMFPIEVRAGSDPVALRERFGRDILLLGGYDKMALLKSEKEILAELKRLEPTVAEGGFIPHVDHRVPADVPLKNYRYYVREKKAMLGYSADDI